MKQIDRKERWLKKHFGLDRFYPNLSHRKLFKVFEKALRKNKPSIVKKVLRDYPDFHDYYFGGYSLPGYIYDLYPEWLEYCLRHGLHPDAGEKPPCTTLLQSAASEGDLEVMKMALQFGADTEKRNDVGEVALGFASHEQFEAVKLLVESGANVNAIEEDLRDGYKSTPLHCAHARPDIHDYLRSKGAKYIHELLPEEYPKKKCETSICELDPAKCPLEEKRDKKR